MINPVQSQKLFSIGEVANLLGLDSEILERTRPKLAVISVGKNKYGHPSKEVIKILRDLDIKFLRTDENGNIEIIVEKNGQFSVR